jgi:antitoxin HicB
MNERLHYSMLVQWPDEDQAYLVQLPEWEGRVFGPVTHGDTYEEAIRHGRDVLEMLVEVAQENGEPLPEPHVFRSAVGAADD